MAGPLLDLDLHALAHQGSPILRDVSVQLAPGETLALVGPSGIGKSSLLRVIAGLDAGFDGICRLNGTCAMVFQEPTLLPWRTVADNIRITTGVSMKEADAALESVGLAGRGADFPSQLSLGQQRRLALARAFAVKPDVLLLDEPFGALDPGTRLSMHDFLQDLRAETGMTVFLVTHDLEEAFKLGDRVLVFDKPRWDPHDPNAFGATITYDFDARDGGIPFQTLQEDTNVFHAT